MEKRKNVEHEKEKSIQLLSKEQLKDALLSGLYIYEVRLDNVQNSIFLASEYLLSTRECIDFVGTIGLVADKETIINCWEKKEEKVSYNNR